MFISFIGSSLLLWCTFGATVALSTILPSALQEIVYFQALSVVVSGFIINAFIGRSYDFLMPAMSSMLPRPVTNLSFAVASGVVVSLILIAAMGLHVDFLQNPQSYPNAQWIGVAIVLAAAGESWAFLPESIPIPIRLLWAVLLGMVLFTIAVLAPVFLIGKIVSFYNAGGASYVAGWTAGLVAWGIGKFFHDAELESEAGKKFIEKVVEREMPVAISVVVVYVAFKSIGINPIIFAVCVGIVSSLVASIVSAGISST